MTPDERPGRFFVECSECRYHAQLPNGSTWEDASRDCWAHETNTGHKGPFHWFLSDELAARIQGYQEADRAAHRRRWGY